jgi:hypothetical protein
MFLLYNIIGWSINELGLADEFVAAIMGLEKWLYPILELFIKIPY